MEKFAIITPDRQDRPMLMNKLVELLAGYEHLRIDFPPTDDKFDLTKRVRIGVYIAKQKGFDKVYIMENDDYYPDNYFEKMAFNGDFVGCEESIYYNIKNKTYQSFHHPRRSSLFCTGFRISALDNFDWPSDDHLWLDIMLWKYAYQNNKVVTMVSEPPALGIKGHGQGKAGGKGHTMMLKNQDKDLSFLRSKVGDSLPFYMSL